MKFSFVTGGERFKGKTTRKYDALARVLWSVDHGTDVYAVASDSSGNIITGGAVAGDSKTTRKYDSSGSLLWSANHGAPIRAICVDSSDNIYTVGDRSSSITVRKYASDGTPSWTYDHGADLKSVILMPNGTGIIIGGVRSSSISHRKLSLSGSSLWSGNCGATIKCMTAFDTANGNLIIVGSSIGLAVYDTDGNLLPTNDSISYNVQALDYGDGLYVLEGDSSTTSYGTKTACHKLSINLNGLIITEDYPENFYVVDTTGSSWGGVTACADGYGTAYSEILIAGDTGGYKYPSIIGVKSDYPGHSTFFRNIGKTYAIRALPHAPNGTLSITSYSYNETAANVHFSYSQLVDYDSIQYRLNGGSAVDASVSGNVASITGLTANASYTIEIRGVNSKGSGPWSDSISITTESSSTVSVPMAISYDSLNKFVNFRTPEVSDPLYLSQQEANYQKYDEVWNITKGHPGIVVTIADCGFLTTHEDLSGAILPGYNAEDGTSNVGVTTCIHGSQMIGTMAMQANNGKGGVGLLGWNTKFYPIKLSNRSDGVTQDSNNEFIANSIVRSADRGYRVFSNSYRDYPMTLDLKDSMEYIESKGGLAVICCGNDNNQDHFLSYLEEMWFGLTSSGWYLTTGSSSLVSGSNGYGYNCWFRTVSPSDVTTDGSLTNNYVGTGGSSGTVPQVAGIITLLFSINPVFGPNDVREIIATTCKSASGDGMWTFGWSYGPIDMVAALQLAQTWEPSDPRGVAWLLDRQQKTVTGSGTQTFTATVIEDVVPTNSVKVQMVYESVGGTLSSPVTKIQPLSGSSAYSHIPAATVVINTQAIQ